MVIITQEIAPETIEALGLESIAQKIITPNKNTFSFNGKMAQVVLLAGYYSADELEMIAKDLRRLEQDGKLA